MANRFPGKSCAVCPNPSQGTGEHVWSSWLIREFEGRGPFRTERSGEPLTRRDGSLAEYEVLQGAHVPMCQGCNEPMGRFIEDPAKQVVPRLLPKSNQPHAWPTLTAEEVRAVAIWLLKVGLLLSHPDVDYDQPQVNRAKLGDAPPKPIPADYLKWMPAGDDPPVGFSVYLSRRAIRDEPWEGDRLRISLPELVVVDEHQLAFFAKELGVTGLHATIVWHLGWPIRHPLVDSGRAVRLWPDPQRIDLARLPEAHPAEFGFVLAPGQWSFTDKQYRSDRLAPLEVGYLPLGQLATEGQPTS